MSISSKSCKTLTDIPLTRSSKNTQNNVNENNGKQLDKVINEDLPSPPKYAKLIPSVNEDHKEKSVELRKCTFSALELTQDKLSNAPQSADLFGDSLLPENLSDLSCMNKKTSCLRNSRSCPNTPMFEVCSEELDVQIDISNYSNLSSLSYEINRSNPIETTPIQHNDSKLITKRLNQNNTDITLAHGDNLLNDLKLKAFTSSKGTNEKDNNHKNFQGKSTDSLNDHINTFKSPHKVKYSHIIARNVNTAFPKIVQTTGIETKCDIQQKECESSHTVRTSASYLRQQSTPPVNLENSLNKPLLHNLTSEYTKASPASFTFSDSDTEAYIEPSPRVSLNTKDNIHLSR